MAHPSDHLRAHRGDHLRAHHGDHLRAHRGDHLRAHHGDHLRAHPRAHFRTQRGARVTVWIAVLVAVSSTARAAPPLETKEDIVCRGLSGEGFSYAWGGECWCASSADPCAPDLVNCDAGYCDPCITAQENNGCMPCTQYSGCCNWNDRSCQHSGTYGADCSGFVSKAWQVPNPHPVEACGVARYEAIDFTSDHQYWDVAPLNDLQPADAVATNLHVILVISYPDAYGAHEVIEAKGCDPGITRGMKSFGSGYHGARRINLLECVCTDGDEETEECGDCGTRTRTCENNCSFSPWSPCEGPDPTGEQATCEIEDGVGVCAEGRRLCVAGWLTCQPTLPSTDVCDGLDNDCDGEVDNGTPAQLGEDLPCTNMCGEGISKCIEGTVRCATLAGEWPIDSCDSTPVDPDAGTADASTGDLSGSASGGCDCRATPDTHRSVFAPAPALSPWMLLVVLTVLLIRKGVRH